LPQLMFTSRRLGADDVRRNGPSVQTVWFSLT
jgi:hypothetical protein